MKNPFVITCLILVLQSCSFLQADKEKMNPDLKSAMAVKMQEKDLLLRLYADGDSVIIRRGTTNVIHISRTELDSLLPKFISDSPKAKFFVSVPKELKVEKMKSVIDLLGRNKVFKLELVTDLK